MKDYSNNKGISNYKYASSRKYWLKCHIPSHPAHNITIGEPSQRRIKKSIATKTTRALLQEHSQNTTHKALSESIAGRKALYMPQNFLFKDDQSYHHLAPDTANY